MKFPLRLFTPAESSDKWHEVRDQHELDLVEFIADRNGLAFRVNEAQGKVYLAHAPKAKPEPAAGDLVVTYPSGKAYPKALISEGEATRYSTTGSYQAAPLIQAAAGDKLSAHFTAGEFMPKDSSYRFLRMSPLLIAKLEKIREIFGGRTLHISSAYRPPVYNRMQGGVANSCHIDGLAADIYIDGVTTEQLRQACEQVIGDGGGVGYYPSQQFVHVDVGGERARWNG